MVLHVAIHGASLLLPLLPLLLPLLLFPPVLLLPLLPLLLPLLPLLLPLLLFPPVLLLPLLPLLLPYRKYTTKTWNQRTTYKTHMKSIESQITQRNASTY